jgi:hypothetical protein
VADGRPTPLQLSLDLPGRAGVVLVEGKERQVQLPNGFEAARPSVALEGSSVEFVEDDRRQGTFLLVNV